MQVILGFITDLNNSSYFINLLRCRKHNRLISNKQVKAWLTAQTTANSMWMIILDLFVVFQCKKSYLHNKPGNRQCLFTCSNGNYLKLTDLVVGFTHTKSWLKWWEIILQDYLVILPRSLTQGAFLELHLHGSTGISCRHVKKLHLTDKQKCHLFQLLAIAKK